MTSRSHRRRMIPAFLLLLGPGMLSAATTAVRGRVVDENGLAVAGARVTLSAPNLPVPLFAFSDQAGQFRFSQVAPETYELRIEKRGFYAFVARSFLVTEPEVSVEITLNHEQEYEEQVSVVYSPPIIDREQTSARSTLTSAEMIDLPFPSTHDFRNALPVIPGIVRDNRGRAHMNGGGENQVYYSLDGFNITSPVAGILENRISVDALRAVRVESSRYSAEHGKGSAGTMVLESARGDDRFRFSATNFLPSFEFHDGLVLGNWNPRATVSGPIVKGRMWYFNALDLQYDLNVVDSLPVGTNRNPNWHGSNLTRIQANLTPRNILTASFLFNFQESRRFGLTALDPLETTRDRRSRFYFFSIKDEAYLTGGWVVEAGLAVNRIRKRETPRGRDLYVIGPEGRSGNFFIDSEERASRVHYLFNVLAPARDWYGRHLLRLGLDVNVIDYRRRADRGPFEVRRLDGSRARLTSFSGEPQLGKDNVELSAYLQDRWSPTDRVMVEAGIRMDWDRVLSQVLWSPRLAATWSPTRAPDTKFAAGIGIVYDATNLELLTRPLDQSRTDAFYDADGVALVRGPVRTTYLGDPATLAAPRYLNLSLGWEQKLPGSVYLRAGFVQRRGLHGWAYDVAPPDGEAETSERRLLLRSHRRDTYRYAELTVTRTFAEKYPWLLSYTRSVSRSTAAIDFSLENPIFARQAAGPNDWDAPGRLISWASLPAPFLEKYTLSYFLEWHSGFPFTAVNERQDLVGTPNDRRFPDYFSLNLHVERRFKMWRYQWALRAGFNNLTGRSNPVVVVNNIDSPRFGRFDGGQGRAFTGRIRFLGRN